MRSSRSILLVVALSQILTSIAYFNSTLDDCSRDNATVCGDDYCCASGGICQNEPSTGIPVCCDTSIDEDCMEDRDPLGIATIPVPTFTTPPFVPPATQTNFAGSSGCDVQPDIQCTSADDAWYCPAYKPVCGTSYGSCSGSGPACLSFIPDSPFATESVDSGDSEPTTAAASNSAGENNSTPSPEPTPSPESTPPPEPSTSPESTPPPEPSTFPEPTPLPEPSPSPSPEPSSPPTPTTSVEPIAPDIPATEAPTPSNPANPTATTYSVDLASSTAASSELGTPEPSLSPPLPSSTPLPPPSTALARNSESSNLPPTTLISNNTSPTDSKHDVPSSPSAPALFTGGVPGRGTSSWWGWVGMGLLSGGVAWVL